MASKPKELSDLQRDLLHLALQGPKAKIWLPRTSQQTFPTTYAAIVSLQRRGLLDSEQVKDPEILSWKLTKEGREALKTAKAVKAEPAPRKEAPPPAEAGPVAGKAPAAALKQSAPRPPAKATAPRKPNGKEAPPPVKAGRSARSTSAVAAEPPRERGGKGQKAVPAASPGRSTGKKATAAKKSGGRGRT